MYALRRPQRLPDASVAYGHGQLPSYEDTESAIITFLISSLERSVSVHRISPTMTDAIALIAAISPTMAYRTRLPPNDHITIDSQVGSQPYAFARVRCL